MRARLAGVAAVCLASALALMVFECGARLIPTQMVGTSPRLLHHPHPTAGIALTPGFSTPDLDPEDKNSHWVATTINPQGFEERNRSTK